MIASIHCLFRAPLGVCLHAAVAICLVLACASQPASAQASLLQRLLNNPDDPELNFALAAEAEMLGDLRHAMAAYERVARSDPGNVVALENFQRLRRELMPAVRSVHANIGASYHDNVRQNPARFRRPHDATVDGSASLLDERTVRGTRIRTISQVGYRIHTHETDLTEVGLGVWTGPVFTVTDTSELHVAVGGVVDYLGDELLYAEASAFLQYSVLHEGIAQTMSLYVAHRDVNEQGPAYTSGFFAEAKARLAVMDRWREGDALFVMPRLRVSEGYNDRNLGGVFSNPLFLQDYVGYGARVAYYLPIDADRVYVGAGISVYDRVFNQTIAFGNNDRRDLFVEPTAHLIFSNVLDRAIDVRVDYRFEHNDSNDRTESFQNHVVGPRVNVRF